MSDSLKLLAVFPHPDDETHGLGSTFARYSVEGVETYLVCATRGERGWYDSEGPDPGLEGVARIREAELRCAAENLACTKSVFWITLMAVWIKLIRLRLLERLLLRSVA